MGKLTLREKISVPAQLVVRTSLARVTLRVWVAGKRLAPATVSVSGPVA
jgi:hypothetical protein